jgi:hypothetical protein
MAKLNGVKTVSERIEYGGVVYAISTESAVAGDIIRITDNDGDSYVTQGGYYVVDYLDSADDPQFTDDDGDDLDGGSYEYGLFKAEASASTPQPSATTSVKRKATVGERIRIVEPYMANGDYAVGDELAVKRVDSDGSGDVRVEINGETRLIILREYEVVVEASATASDVIVHEGVQYRKIARKADVGEYVVITDNNNGHGYETGEIVKATGRYEWDAVKRGIESAGEDGMVRDTDYLTLEPVAIPQSLPDTLPSEYVIHDGKVYVKEAREAKRGDIVYVTPFWTHSWETPIIGVYGDGSDVKSDTPTKNGLYMQSVSSPKLYSVLTPVTSVTINGAVYTLESRKVTEGDAVLVVKSGATFYNVNQIVVLHAKARVFDSGHINYADGEYGMPDGVYVVLTPKPVTPQYTEVKRKARVGERIRPLKDSGFYKKDKTYEVTLLSPPEREEYVHFTDDTGDRWHLRNGEYVVLEESAIPNVEPTATPQKSVRLAVGDYAKVTPQSFGNVGDHVGEIVKVTRAEYDGRTYPYKVSDLNGKEIGLASDREVVRATDAEVAEAKRKLAVASVKVGDSVRLTIADGERPSCGWGAVKNGDVGVVTSITASDGRARFDFPNQTGWNGKLSEVTPLSSEELAEIKALASATQRLKVGEYARAVGPQPHAAYRKEGDIVKIAEDDGSTRPFRTTNLDGSRAGWAYVADLERVSSAEVEAFRKQAEIDAKQAEETAKWSAIGRKVNEYKTGDIVEVVDRGSSRYPVGTIAPIVIVAGDGTYALDAYNDVPCSWIATRRIKLVTPVEQRFDR